jgi:hypothetical protein
MHASDPNHHGIRDFDFLFGNWRVENRRLRKRLQDCHEWETFEAIQHCQPLPGAIGNYDDFVANTWLAGYIGMSLRLFNPQTKLWSIYWLDNKNGGMNGSGALMPPVVGKFENGAGVFECDDELDGKPIRVRYRWSDIMSASPSCEQFMSPDQGKTWEKNWHMQFHRVA